MTTLLRIEHPVADFNRWRQAFDSDPDARVVDLVEESALAVEEQRRSMRR